MVVQNIYQHRGKSLSIPLIFKLKKRECLSLSIISLLHSLSKTTQYHALIIHNLGKGGDEEVNPDI